MTKFLKTFLLWILIGVVPLHAGASVIGMSCLPAHNESLPVPGATGGHHHGAESGSDHHHEAAGHAASAVDGANTADAAEDVKKLVHLSCSACTVFCTAAVAPPSALNPISTFDGSEPLVVSPGTLFVGFIPDGPLRPPQHLSA